MRNKIAEFLEWLARRLREPEGLEVREIVFDGDDLVKDGAIEQDASPIRINGMMYVELPVSEGRYLHISYRSLRRFLRKKVSR